MSDAIIVLGRGIGNDGSLPIDLQARIRKSVELYKDARAPFIIMSGAWSYRDGIKSKFIESTAMKKYAIGLGISADNIIEEHKSKDTVGNIYFTKKDICEPRQWRNLILVTSDEHMARVKYLVDKIYGPDYNFNFSASGRVFDNVTYQIKQKRENESLSITKQWIDSVEPGDDAAIWQLMITKHAAYMPHDNLL